jgi:hypothetical protein
MDPAGVEGDPDRQSRLFVPARRASRHAQLSIGVMVYTPTALGIDELRALASRHRRNTSPSRSTSGDQAKEATLSFIPYERWRSSYNRGVHDAGKPVHWSIAPTARSSSAPKPDKAYMIRGEYQRGPQILAADGDIPIMPDAVPRRDHMARCMMLAEHDEAPRASERRANIRRSYLNDMGRDLLPAFELGGNALA